MSQTVRVVQIRAAPFPHSDPFRHPGAVTSTPAVDLVDPATVLGGRLVLLDEVVDDGVVEIVGGQLGYVGPASGWSGAAPSHVGTIAPGLIDIHCHGGGGSSVTTGVRSDIDDVARHHLRHGTTTMLASLVTAEPDDITAGVAAIADAADAGSSIVGSHLEGPFLGVGHCGAHEPGLLRAPDRQLVEGWLSAGRGTVRMMTIAPELDDADAVSRLVAEHGALVAVGHTDADAVTFGRALATSSVSVVTHLFNGMAPMHHRAPGPVAASLAALARGGIHVELIADGVHLADETVALVFDLDTSDCVVLVSDAMTAAGMPDGTYQLGPLEVRVTDGVARTTSEPAAIAGSTACLADVVRRCILQAGIDPPRAFRAASATPARLLRLADRGRLATGLRADLVLLDDSWAVTGVTRAGERVV